MTTDLVLVAKAAQLLLGHALGYAAAWTASKDDVCLIAIRDGTPAALC